MMGDRIRIRIPSYTITIANKSGSKQSYGLFAETPGVRPSVSNIRTSIITTFPGVASGTGQARLDIQKQLFALCGLSRHDGDVSDSNVAVEVGDALDSNTGIDIFDKRPVTLGTKLENGQFNPGSEWNVVVSQGSPSFSEDTSTKFSGELGAFCIKTGTDFTALEAKRGTILQRQTCHNPSHASLI